MNIFHPTDERCIPMQQQTQSIKHFAMDAVLLQRLLFFATEWGNKKYRTIKHPVVRQCSDYQQTTCRLHIIWRVFQIYVFIKSTTAVIFYLSVIFYLPLQHCWTISPKTLQQKVSQIIKSSERCAGFRGSLLENISCKRCSMLESLEISVLKVVTNDAKRSIKDLS